MTRNYNTTSDIWTAGAFAVVIVDFLIYPFDTLKTRIQSPNYSNLYKDAHSGLVKKSLLFRGLYQGVGSVVLATVPASGAFFTTYETAKLAFSKTSLPTPLAHALASSSAEAVSCFILTPAEVIKQNAQVLVPKNSNSNPKNIPPQEAKPKSPTHQIITKFKSRPWMLWSGYGALLGRNLPFTGLHFPLFEYVRGRIVGVREKMRDGGSGWGGGVGERAVVTGVAAGVSGSFASVVTTPVDVVKTRVMLGASGEGEGKSRGRMGNWDMGRQVLKEEGVRGLFRGGAIRSVWAAVGLSVYLGIYEGGRFYLERRRRAKDGV